MLSLANRSPYQTLLDAAVLRDADDSPAVIYVSSDAPPVTVTRAEFAQSAAKYGNAMRDLGIEPRDLVVIAHTQNLESMYAFWGALLIGAIPSMFTTLTEKLDPDIYMANLNKLVSLSEVRAVLTSDDFAPTLSAQLTCPVFSSEMMRNRTVNADLSPAIPDADDIAFLQHSSGSTGLQKGVALSHRAVLNQLASYCDAIALNKQDVIVSWLPLYHDMGLIAGFILPLIQGIPLVLMSPFDWVKSPVMLFRAIHEYQGTLCWLPNFAYNHCARRIRSRDLEGLSAASMRMFINCSEPVYRESHDQFVERFGFMGVTASMMAVSYAMAENTFAVTQTSPGEAAQVDSIDRVALQNDLSASPVSMDHPNAVVKVSCGKPISGVEVHVHDEQGRILPDRRVGEIAIRSDFMMSEYYKRPDLQPFIDGWYLTGDRGYVADGEVYVVGRSKDLIINAGKNVYPQDIETVVNQIAGVHAGRVVSFGVMDERDGTELIAVVAEVQSDDAQERKQLNAQIHQAVAQSCGVTVTYVHFVDDKWLLKTSSGKIARNANREKWLSEKSLPSV